MYILLKDNRKIEEASKIAQKLKLVVKTEKKEKEKERELILVFDQEKIYLTDGNMEIKADFHNLDKRISRSNLQKEILLKAVRIKGIDRNLQILDATAGLGEDSLILAASGAYVRLYEYDSIIALLLEDAIKRAKCDENLRIIAERMELHNEDSILAMNNLDYRPDVVLLDPMFPERQKTAKVKKKFQLLQQLESPCSNEADLLIGAIKANPTRIVIKRPAKGPYLAGQKPDYSVEGKAIRYDCILNSSYARILKKLEY